MMVGIIVPLLFTRWLILMRFSSATLVLITLRGSVTCELTFTAALSSEYTLNIQWANGANDFLSFSMTAFAPYLER